MKFIDLFAGIGGFRKGMEEAGHTCVGFCEFDKFAVMSYAMMHLATPEQRQYIESIPAPLKKNGEPNLRKRQQEILKEEYRNGEWYANDITAVDAASMPDADIWCFGAPCQDFSIAGTRKGLTGDRSSLVKEVFRLLAEKKEESRPKYIIYENVKGMLSSNNGWDFACILLEMESLGYDVEYQLLNSKDFGVPQNRERVYTIGHFRGRGSGKIFPIGKTDGLHYTTEENRAIHEIAQCLTAGGNDKWQGDYIVKQIGNCMPTATRDNPNQGRIYDTTGLAPFLNKMDGGGREPLIPISLTQKTCKETDISPTLTARGPSRGRGNNSPVPGVLIREATKKGYTIAEEGDSINLTCPNSSTRRGRVGKGIANTLDTSCNQGIPVKADGIYTGPSENFRRPPLKGLGRCLKSGKHDAGVYDGLRIRRLTPKECFRLQGWEDIYFHRAAVVNTDSQLYKQAGNGVTVNVVRAIGERLK